MGVVNYLRPYGQGVGGKVVEANRGHVGQWCGSLWSVVVQSATSVASCLQLTDGTMFRKKQDVAERSRSLLKNSAAKKIKAEILVALPTLSKDVIDELMPNKVRIPYTYIAHRFPTMEVIAPTKMGVHVCLGVELHSVFVG